MSTAQQPSEIPTYDVIVAGAGFSGLYAIHRLREEGLTVKAFERGGDLGGAWYWNRYPGLQCDTETISYAFFFDKDLYRDWTWSRRFAPQPEILEYASYVADRLDLRRDIQFNTAIERATYLEEENLWELSLSDGTTAHATYFIAATGPLAAVNIPKLEGSDVFAGEMYHTGDWPHEPVDFTGKKVAVIGTGSSGVQIITKLAPEVAEMVVFQRTAQYITPARQRLLTPEYVKEIKDNLDNLIYQATNNSFGAPGVATEKYTYEDTPEQQQETFQWAWDAGAQAFALATYKDLTDTEEANKIPADFVRGKIAEIVEDPETARKLMPDYYFGTKRPVKADGYYETFNRENVHLVSLKEEPIVAITERGIRTSTREYEFDIIVYATGFDAVTGSLFKFDIVGRDGVTLRQKWDEGRQIESLYGIQTSGFPNLFFAQGPQSTTIVNSYINGIQVNVGFISRLIGHAFRNGTSTVEAQREAEQQWAAHCQELVEGTLMTKTPSFWNGANIAEKPKPEIFPIYFGGLLQYRLELEKSEQENYRGFTVTNAEKTLSPVS